MTTPCDENINCPGCDKAIIPVRDNQPGLPAISYRLGTHGEFFQRMFNTLHTEKVLREQLTTRSRDDFAIALLDAWAVIGDILSFYQERIANEGYLRTATERRSILEMARTISYELNPGVAASTYLAFAVDNTNPASAVSEIPQGTQVQSIPAPGERPQTFETSNDFEAHVEWNELKPRRSIPQILGIQNSKLFTLRLCNEDESSKEFVGNYNVVNPDSTLLPADNIIAEEVNQIYLKGIANNLKPGDIILFVGIKGLKKAAVVKTIVSITINKELNRTDVFFTANAVTDKNSRLPHYSAKTRSTPQSISSGLELNKTNIEANILNSIISEQALQALIRVNRWSQSEMVKHITEVRTEAVSAADGRGVFALREHLGFFGNNAPKWASLPIGQREGTYTVNNVTLTGEPVYSVSWDKSGWHICYGYDGSLNGISYLTAYGVHVFLERPVEGIGSDSWVVFKYPDEKYVDTYVVCQIQNTLDQSVTGFSFSAKTTGLKLKDIIENSITDPNLKVRTTNAYVKSESLELIDLPVGDDLKEETKDYNNKTLITGVSSLMLDGLVPGLQIGQPVIVNGERADTAGITCHEVVTLKDIFHALGYTILFFKEHLQYQYLRDTVTINANVIPATHGETVKEVLGIGDGTATNQEFILKKPPLTYVSAATSSGSASTLTVRVNAIEWEPAASLYNLGPRSRSYIVRLTNEGNVHVIFGDGRQGARLPTGGENITAVYRSGIGSEGEVSADSIKLLKTRPAGIKGVNNPVPATGFQNPETMEDARANAPRTILTMDRIVSLQDYEDFSRTYAGIGKAQAVVLWNGENELVHITVADSNGDTLASDSDTYKNLCDSIDIYRDRLSTIQVDTFELQLFQVEAKLLIDKQYVSNDVLDKASAALRDVFTFTNRDFGQPVAAAEIISILQEIPGVIAVDLDKLYLTDSKYQHDLVLGPGQKNYAPILPASKARWPQGQSFQKAQLLLINQVGIKLKEMES
jgi:hypothetical protein